MVEAVAPVNIHISMDQVVQDLLLQMAVVVAAAHQMHQTRLISITLQLVLLTPVAEVVADLMVIAEVVAQQHPDLSTVMRKRPFHQQASPSLVHPRLSMHMEIAEVLVRTIVALVLHLKVVGVVVAVVAPMSQQLVVMRRSSE
jgi:hypothetical protein